MGLNPTSQAAAVGASVQNVQFSPQAQVLPRKIWVIGAYDSVTYTKPTVNTPTLVLSPEDAGAKYGFGSQVHRLVRSVFQGAQGIPVWVSGQPEVTDASVGSIQFTSDPTANGTFHLYLSGDYIPVPVSKDDTAENVATNVAGVISAYKDSPVSATAATDTVTLTAKNDGLAGDDITIKYNLFPGQELPAGLADPTITDMTGGAGVPDIQQALDGNGTDDDANELGFTDLVHGYGQDSDTLDAISEYVGEGNDFVGLYAKTVARPFRSMTGDNATGTSGLIDLISLADLRKEDRANGVIAVPGSPNHPSEIAAVAVGVMAKTNNTRAEENYNGKTLPGVIPGEAADRWTSRYDSRDAAVKNGISPTAIEAGTVKMTNVMSFYRPDDVPTNSNGYKAMRNISILQNILFNVKLNFSQEKWQGITIVEDLAKVSNATSKEKARDKSTVESDLIALAKEFEANAWIFTSSFTINEIKQGDRVVIRAGGTGFDCQLPIILSGNAVIIDVVTQFDTSLVALQG